MAINDSSRFEAPQDFIVHEPGKWTPSEVAANKAIVQSIAKPYNKDAPLPDLLPSVQALRDLIEGDPQLYMYFTSMFQELPEAAPSWRDPYGMDVLENYEHMLQAMNNLISGAPVWTERGVETGYVAAPMAAMMAYPMGTRSGVAAFLDKPVNKCIKRILNDWGKFLSSPASTHTLVDSESGWFSKKGIESIMQVANAPYDTSLTFEQMFECDPKAPHYGFKSWDEFFIRSLREGTRPIASPEDDTIIANACESKVYNIQRGARLRDQFFAKGEPYSVLDMLAHDPLSCHFDGATVYQAFLSGLSYHRWHAPVSGTVRRAFVQDGTYFSQRYLPEEQPSTQFTSQGYLSAMATRGIIIIEADSAAIGMVGFIAIGMDEVSSCEITVKEGQKINKGDEMGMFHYGGSSHCMLFRGGLELDFFPVLGSEANVPVRGKLAEVKVEEKRVKRRRIERVDDEKEKEQESSNEKVLE